MRRLQVLVASSDYFVKKQLVRNLLCEDHDVWVSSDGQSALRLAREISADIVIADEKLPGISGSDLCRRLRPFPFSIPTPFTFLLAADENTPNPYVSLHQGIDVTVCRTDLMEFMRNRCFHKNHLPRSVRSNLGSYKTITASPAVHMSA